MRGGFLIVIMDKFCLHHAIAASGATDSTAVPDTMDAIDSTGSIAVLDTMGASGAIDSTVVRDTTDAIGSIAVPTTVVFVVLPAIVALDLLSY